MRLIFLFVFKNLKTYVMHVRKKFNVFYFCFPKSFLEKKYKLCNGCETKYLVFLYLYFLKWFFRKNKICNVCQKKKYLIFFYFRKYVIHARKNV